MDTLFNKLRNLDAYPKINEDFYSRTLSGGVITIASSIFMLLLFISELSMSLYLFVFVFLFNLNWFVSLRISRNKEVHILYLLVYISLSVSWFAVTSEVWNCYLLRVTVTWYCFFS